MNPTQLISKDPGCFLTPSVTLKGIITAAANDSSISIIDPRGIWRSSYLKLWNKWEIVQTQYYLLTHENRRRSQLPMVRSDREADDR